jgi:hypothetical protein
MRECWIWITNFGDDWILEKHWKYLKGLNGPGLYDCSAHENSAEPSSFWREPKAHGQMHFDQRRFCPTVPPSRPHPRAPPCRQHRHPYPLPEPNTEVKFSFAFSLQTHSSTRSHSALPLPLLSSHRQGATAQAARAASSCPSLPPPSMRHPPVAGWASPRVLSRRGPLHRWSASPATSNPVVTTLISTRVSHCSPTVEMTIDPPWSCPHLHPLLQATSEGTSLQTTHLRSRAVRLPKLPRNSSLLHDWPDDLDDHVFALSPLFPFWNLPPPLPPPHGEFLLPPPPQSGPMSVPTTIRHT